MIVPQNHIKLSYRKRRDFFFLFLFHGAAVAPDRVKYPGKMIFLVSHTCVTGFTGEYKGKGNF